MILRVGNVSDELLAILVVVLFLFLIAGIAKGIHFLYHKYILRDSIYDQINGIKESE